MLDSAKVTLRLSERLAGRDNNLNLIRMIAATCVLVSHAFALTSGDQTTEPLVSLTGETLGHFAVIAFFAISGLLIARSFDRRLSIGWFLKARFLRLWPALFITLVLTAFLLGPCVTSLRLAGYFVSPDGPTYVLRNLVLVSPQQALPGVFSANPIPAVNGSLWTLAYEVACYLLVVMIGLLGLLDRIRFIVVFAACWAFFFAFLSFNPQYGLLYRLDLMADLSFAFLCGTACYVWRDNIVLDGRIAVFAAGMGVVAVAGQGAWTIPVLYLALIYLVFYLAYVPKGRALAYNRLGDFSYGMYIFAFPVQQTAIHFGPGQSAWENILVSLPATLMMAVVSWKLIEEPALRLAKPRTAPPVKSRDSRA